MKPYAKLVLAAALALNLVGCAITTWKTRTLNPDGTSTVETPTINPDETSMVETSAVETPTINPDGTPFGPWIGSGTPWVFYGECWYYNGLLYGYYGNYGWWPFGYYPFAYLVKPAVYYTNATVVNFYRNNPNLVQKASQQYYSAQRRDAAIAHSGNVRPVAHSGGYRAIAHSGNFRPVARSGGYQAIAHSGNVRPVARSGGSRAVALNQHRTVTATNSFHSTSRTSTSKKATK